MTFINRWCAGWLRSTGHRVSDPGTPDPADPRVAAPMLRALGWTLFVPGIEPPVSAPTLAEVIAMAVSQGCTVLMPGEVALVSVERAKEVLHAARMTVLPPIHQPNFGPWVPKLGPDGAVLHPTRIVDSITPGGMVSYTEGGAMRECRLLHFWAWRKRVGATLENAAVRPHSAMPGV